MILTVTLNTSVDKLYRIAKLTPYEVMRVSDVRTTAGGKGLNVARAVALSGEKAVAMGFVGGFSGKLFTSLLPDYIGTRFTQVKAETRSCINVWDQQNNRSTEFLEPGNPVTEEELRRFLSDFELSLPDAEVVALSGSLPKGVPEDFYGQLVELAHRYKKYVILDSSGSSLKKACLVTLKSSTKTSLICVCLTKMLSVLFFQAYLKFCQPIIGLTKQNTTSFLKRRTRASSSG